MLLSEGFKEAASLSKKIVTIYELMTQQFSKQALHLIQYHFQLLSLLHLIQSHFQLLSLLLSLLN
jgi:hypothetical protein